MSNQVQGLKKALVATREKNRELQQKNQLLTNIVEHSNMRGMLKLIELSESYSGGIFERLGFKSQLLTAIAWSEYPNNSFSNLVENVDKFCPEMAELFGEHGINFAVVAEGESDPGEDKMWQLVYDFAGAESKTKELRLYLLELFLDIPNQDLVEQLYIAHQEKLEQSVDQFEKEVIREVITSLEKEYRLSLADLEVVVCLPC